MTTISMKQAFDDRLPLETFNGEVIDCNGFNVFSPFDMEDAGAIIHAVNSHDELVAQRDALLSALERLISSDPNVVMFPTSELAICAENESLSKTLREQAASVIQARAAIAKAKVGE